VSLRQRAFTLGSPVRSVAVRNKVTFTFSLILWTFLVVARRLSAGGVWVRGCVFALDHLMRSGRKASAAITSVSQLSIGDRARQPGPLSVVRFVAVPCSLVKSLVFVCEAQRPGNEFRVCGECQPSGIAFAWVRVALMGAVPACPLGG